MTGPLPLQNRLFSLCEFGCPPPLWQRLTPLVWVNQERLDKYLALETGQKVVGIHGAPAKVQMRVHVPHV